MSSPEEPRGPAASLAIATRARVSSCHRRTAPVDVRQDVAHRFSVVDLMPSGRKLGATETALREAYGRMVYRVRW